MEDKIDFEVELIVKDGVAKFIKIIPVTDLVINVGNESTFVESLSIHLDNLFSGRKELTIYMVDGVLDDMLGMLPVNKNTYTMKEVLDKLANNYNFKVGDVLYRNSNRYAGDLDLLTLRAV